MVMEKKMNRREFMKASAATGAILSMAPQYLFSRRTEIDSAPDASTWWWQSSNATIVEKEVFERIQPQTFAQRGSFKSPVGRLRDQSP